MTSTNDAMFPEWTPLESAIPKADCADFMFMGSAGAIMQYKHRTTRRYLNIDANGKFYQYHKGRYVEIDGKEALRNVYE